MKGLHAKMQLNNKMFCLSLKQFLNNLELFEEILMVTYHFVLV